jgi:hypothetical protein
MERNAWTRGLPCRRADAGMMTIMRSRCTYRTVTGTLCLDSIAFMVGEKGAGIRICFETGNQTLGCGIGVNGLLLCF